MDWMKIGSALLLIMMIIYIFPRAKQMMNNSPQAEAGDWQGAIFPLLAVVLFVVLLVKMVQQMAQLNYYDSVCRMIELNVNSEYIDGWMAGYLRNPRREEEEITFEYSSGFEDGLERDQRHFCSWVVPLESSLIQLSPTTDCSHSGDCQRAYRSALVEELGLKMGYNINFLKLINTIYQSVEIEQLEKTLQHKLHTDPNYF